LKHSIKKMRSSPKWVRQSIGQAGSFAFPIILGASALALYSGVKLNNPLVNLMLSFLLAGSIIAQQESLLALALHLSWSDAHKLLKKPVKKFRISWAVMAITGGAIGFTLAIFLVDNTFFGYLFVLIMVGAMIAFIFKNKDKTGGRAVPVLFILIFICMVATIPAFADDGGWQESGGTFDKWIMSEGALIAILLGLPPAVGMGLGILIGSAIAQGIVITGGQSITAGGITEEIKDTLEDVEEQDLKEGIEEDENLMPEDPAITGIMIASSNIDPILEDIRNFFVNYYEKHHSKKPTTPEEQERIEQLDEKARRTLRGNNKEKSLEETFFPGIFGDKEPPTPEELERNNQLYKTAREILEEGVFGSGGKLPETLMNIVGTDPTTKLIEQVKRERVDKSATQIIRMIRFFEKLNLEKIPGGDFSGVPDALCDSINYDARDLIDITGIYKYSSRAHEAYKEFIRIYKEEPNPDSLGDVKKFKEILQR